MSAARSRPVVLVAGGLYDGAGAPGSGAAAAPAAGASGAGAAGAGAAAFWEAPGVAPALRRLGWTVHTPERAGTPGSWDDEARHLAVAIESVAAAPAAVVAASNGCSAALRLALDRPQLVDRLVLCWPATGDDAEVHRTDAERLRGRGVGDDAVARLLDGELVRGVGEAELLGLTVPVTLVPAEPDDPWHQRRTVASLRNLVPRAAIGLGTPPSTSPRFGPHLGALVALFDMVLTG